MVFGEQPPKLNTDFSNVIIIDNLPVVDEKKLQKLKDYVATKLFVDKKSKTKISPKDGGVDIPLTNGKTLGYGIVMFENPRDAKAAIAMKDGKSFPTGKGKPPLILALSQYTSFEDIMNTPDEFVIPDQKQYQQEVKPIASNWLLDDFGRDQFVIREGPKTKLFWNDPVRRPDFNGAEALPPLGNNGVTTKVGPVKFSPKGTYLVSFHGNGVQLWLPPDFRKAVPFSHPSVAEVVFSPCERYLFTAGRGDQKSGFSSVVVVWNIQAMMLTGPAAENVKESAKKRVFKVKQDMQWNQFGWVPIFQFSYDGSFFSRHPKYDLYGDKSPKASFIQLYRSSDFTGFQKIDVSGVKDAQWSPGRLSRNDAAQSNLLVYWIPSPRPDQPASIILQEINATSRKIVRENNIFCKNMEMHWQKNGEFLAFQITEQKTKKSLTTKFEVCRLREKGFPIEPVDTKQLTVFHIMKDSNEPTTPNIRFSWEPTGRVFAIIHEDEKLERDEGQSSQKSTGMVKVHFQRISFYHVKKKKTVLLQTLNQTVGNLHWSPAGGVVVMTAQAGNGSLTFYNPKTDTILAEVEHFKCTGVEWDPSGRYLISSATAKSTYAAENGYRVWNSRGDQLVSVSATELALVSWRPRPPTLLTPQQKAEIRKTSKQKYWPTFEAEAAIIRRGNQSAAIKERESKKRQWREFIESCAQTYDSQQESRQELQNGESDNEDDYHNVDVVVTSLISLEEKVLSTVGGTGLSNKGNPSLLF
jgi:translation initiation factor 3 subunit B